jgi:hypothetical protein
MKTKITSKQWFLILGFVMLLLGIIASAYLYVRYVGSKNTKVAPTTEKVVKQKEIVSKPKEVVIPDTFDLVVPYTVQAPGANWKVHEESCEEAAVLMYQKYLLGEKTDIPASVADTEIRAMKAWQVKNYGIEPDLSIEKLGQFSASYYGDGYRTITGLTVEMIKGEVSAGRPVVVPVMTQSLKNPHYSPGNVYHVLVIKGYDQTGVITNDPGVKEGKNWHYTYEILFGAIDAANAKIPQGRVGLTLSKN